MTGIVILVRLGSKRLSQKHLIEANGKPLLAYLIDRIASEFENEIKQNLVTIVIGTSDEPRNSVLEDFANRHPVRVFFGNKTNVPLRLSEAAAHYGFDNIISVDGDDVLISRKALRDVYIALENNHQYVKTTGLPIGMNAWGFSARYLKERMMSFGYIEALETGWGRVFEEKDCFQIRHNDFTDTDRIRLTLDYKEDAELFTKIIESFPDTISHISDAEIINEIVDKELFKINQVRIEEYWVNFTNEINKEKTE